ncbi:hypothetical protein HOLleu_16264 [Holothuria leucospilota]|uniref:Uncharacterized protein n=1 Tax=Holothuria leucospilota TaxID=206669 RepID=A0A9Q1C6F1_HOLLE|nr:hypothetical protein HOLleu_16264 [Holothuria leucospilota]
MAYYFLFNHLGSRGAEQMESTPRGNVFLAHPKTRVFRAFHPSEEDQTLNSRNLFFQPLCDVDLKGEHVRWCV